MGADKVISYQQMDNSQQLHTYRVTCMVDLPNNMTGKCRYIIDVPNNYLTAQW